MLFNATHSEELRVAIVDGQKLVDLDMESAIRAEKKGNIYKARVTRVEPSLEAAFVEFGAHRQGFLPFKEISRSEFHNVPPQTPMAQVRIQDAVREGQELLVQVEKDERGTKGAALTTFISLAGRYLVLMPNNPKGGGISRRIIGDERIELRDNLASLALPTEHSLIARTAGIGKTQEDLQWDLDFLLSLWTAIENAKSSVNTPFLMYQESNLIVRAIRDYLRTDIQEILIDHKEIYERAEKFMGQVMPHNIGKLKYYSEQIPLFSRYQIEQQIEDAHSRTVRLPSGGSVVIDYTEALVTVDVNSSRATRGADIEETALQTNLEAVEEIARQLKIRDLGGLVVLDLIDMTSAKNTRLVEQRLQDAIKSDRARIQTGRISRFGILELSRQRLRSSISDANYSGCPHCDGTGRIRNLTSAGLSLLRVVEEEALKENTEAVYVEVPVETAAFLLNEKRHELNQIEKNLGTRVTIMPSTTLKGRQFEVRRLRSEDLDDSGKINIDQIKNDQKKDVKDPLVKSVTDFSQQQKPAVNYSEVTTPKRVATSRGSTRSKQSPPTNLVSRILRKLTGNENPTDNNSGDISSNSNKPARKTSHSPAKNVNKQPNRNRNRQQATRSDGQSNNDDRGRNSGNRNRNRNPNRRTRGRNGPNRQRSNQQQGRNDAATEKNNSQKQ